MNDEACLFCAFRKGRADGAYLVNRCVSRVELTRQVVKARIATGLPDFSFLCRGHLFGPGEARIRTLGNNQRCFVSLNMTSEDELALDPGRVASSRGSYSKSS